MTTEYIGYIKQTKSGKFRCALGTLHNVGESDGDRVIHEVLLSEMFETLEEAKTEMITNCVNNDIEKYSIVPIRKVAILFESQLEL